MVDPSTIDALAELLCETAADFGWRDSESRPLRPWATLHDGSSRAEYEVTNWRKLATRVLEDLEARRVTALEQLVLLLEQGRLVVALERLVELHEDDPS